MRARRPLEGLRVLDFTRLLPGPYASMVLADLGAEVLRVGSATREDPVNLMPPAVDGGAQSAASAWLGRGKRSLGLNLKAPGAVEIVHRLLDTHDVLLEGFRPGVMSRFGLGYDDLAGRWPRLIYASISGYGQGGPLRDRAGHDLNYMALSGLMSYTGRATEGPTPLGLQAADLAAASNLVIGVLAAVVARAASGAGQQVDASMLDAAVALNGMAGAAALAADEDPVRAGDLLTGGSLYDYYETRDGRHLAFGGIEPPFFAAFCQVIGRPDLISGWIMPPDLEEARAQVRAIIRTRDLAEWRALFEELDACTEPVLTVREALDSPQAAARGVVVEVTTAGGERLRQIATPIRFSAADVTPTRAGVATGADNHEVLSELAFTDDEIRALHDEGVIEGRARA